MFIDGAVVVAGVDVDHRFCCIGNGFYRIACEICVRDIETHTGRGRVDFPQKFGQLRDVVPDRMVVWKVLEGVSHTDKLTEYTEGLHCFAELRDAQFSLGGADSALVDI
ncbi:hypothetical protein ES705_42844 [subsurface metagenome]